MKRKVLKRILIGAGATFLTLVLVLCVHIYMVTRPKAPDAHTIVMARVDIHQPVTKDDEDHITGWFYNQPGVDHVVCNAAMDNVVFTFYPVKADADEIVNRFRDAFSYAGAIRYIPSEKEMQGGCPVASTSYSYKMYTFIKHVF